MPRWWWGGDLRRNATRTEVKDQGHELQVTNPNKPIELRDRINRAKEKRPKLEDEPKRMKCFWCQEGLHC
jgi:hypothetical protein